MSDIKKSRALLRADLFKFSLQYLESLGASQSRLANAMAPLLAKAFEVEAKLSDDEVLQALEEGPGDQLLKELRI